MGICSVYVSGWCIPLTGTHLWSAHVYKRLIISVLLVPFDKGDSPRGGDDGMVELVLLFT